MNNHIRELRAGRGWTQADLAELLQGCVNAVDLLEDVAGDGKFDSLGLASLVDDIKQPAEVLDIGLNLLGLLLEGQAQRFLVSLKFRYTVG